MALGFRRRVLEALALPGVVFSRGFGSFGEAIRRLHWAVVGRHEKACCAGMRDRCVWGHAAKEGPSGGAATRSGLLKLSRKGFRAEELAKAPSIASQVRYSKGYSDL